ncbi:AAA family ATPase [Coleofasciculus sp. B1-GNL1-01]|uniref:AAA family ATPase n=1 Tax=Coleofasciculus sp. B1-GNL1-01 TaxID=3068484 RepID=UPI00406394BD
MNSSKPSKRPKVDYWLMLKDIEITNFRGFEATKFSGFKKVNLIGGQNNAGKTAFLESILLNNCPKSKTIIELKRIRKEASDVEKAMPERAWNSFFFNQDKRTTIKITGTSIQNINTIVEILVCHSISLLKEILEDEEEARKLMTLISKNELMSSVLQVRVIQDNQEISKYPVIATSDGILLHDIPDYKNLPILPSFGRLSNKDLTEEYDKARLNDKDEEIIKAFKILDPSIETVESFSIGEPTLYLVRKEQKGRLPLSLFGDAINRVAAIMLKLINNDYNFLLIDEIENGIHYTKQGEFWEHLFKLASELDIQIFATTHSLEMIKAFTATGVSKYPDMGAYFEIARKPRNHSIIGINRDLETLKYAIEHGKGVRGE